MKQIEKIIKEFIIDKNLNDEASIEVFSSHMNALSERIKNGECIDQPLEKAMIDEIGEDNLKLAEEFFGIFAKELNLNKTTSFEIFLISTHISLLKK